MLVRRSQVCLSTFYQEGGESAEPEPDRRWVQVKGLVLLVLLVLMVLLVLLVLLSRAAGHKDVDENSNKVTTPSRGLAAKLQQLLTPTRHRASVRRAASVDERRGRGGGRRVSEQRQSRKVHVAETLLRAKEKLVSATSEVI